MAGQMSRSLVLASKTIGWDPTVIEGFGSIAEWDRDPGRMAAFNPTFPSKTVAPDDSTYDNVSPNGIDFVTPDVARENAKYTNNSNPYPGFDGGY